MKAKIRRLLVVDAAVLTAAGGIESLPGIMAATTAQQSPAGRASDDSRTRANCRQVLKTILRVCHRATITAAILDEWDRNQRGFAKDWRVSMIQAGKRIELIEPRERS